jgi:tyrosine aminotransferase
VSALSKIYTVPGWRLGWLIVYNNHNYFDKVLDHLNKHSMIQLHPSSIIQYALPAIFKNTPDDFFINLKRKLKEIAEFAYAELQGIRGIKPTKSRAAMYMMVQIDLEEFKDIIDDVDFSKKFLEEQCVLVFPS